VSTMIKRILLALAKQYTSIGGQAVIEGVMMRSPNSFIVAVRKADGSIRVRKSQWFGLSKKLNFLKMPFFRGVLILFETMANGIVSLNYSANIAMNDEIVEEAKKKGLTDEEIEKKMKSQEKVGFATFVSIFLSFLFGIALFVMLPHGLTALLENTVGAKWGLDSFEFHAVDGIIKAFIFLLYIFLIGFFPDIKRVFQYHGAEHKSISTFEAGEDLNVENARKYTTFHPRCGTTFIFFLLFISIILFAIIFAFITVGEGQPVVIKHLMAIGLKIILTIPIAGISYELIKLVGKRSDTFYGKIMSFPGLMLQRLTTREPDDEQLEVALISIRTTLYLEEKYNLKEVSEKAFAVEEMDVQSLAEIESSNLKLKDFLE
jgi:uncharacterized protein YqhQ